MVAMIWSLLAQGCSLHGAQAVLHTCCLPRVTGDGVWYWACSTWHVAAWQRGDGGAAEIETAKG